jgi:hypothetical protein
MYLILSSVIIGSFMVCGTIILGRYIASSKENNEIGTYQMIKVDEKDIVILDTRTAQYWKSGNLHSIK